MNEARVPSPPFAVASIILSMGLMATGNGVMFAYIPLKLAFEGFAPWVAGTMLTALAAGGIGGCLMAGVLVRRVGHARVFAALVALVILSVIVISLKTEPVTWILARALYGFAMTGLFIISQSWLNDASENAWRGRVIAVFYMTYVFAIGAGGYALKFIDLETLEGPLLGLFFAALAILPVSLTRLRTPPPPEAVSIAVAATWRISPVGFLGLLTVGGLTMLISGFAPIYAAGKGYAKDEIALLLFLMQFGMIGVQYPLGAISDRTDRRYVLVVACAIVVGSAALASQVPAAGLLWLILIFAVWSGATETIYSVASAHANDRAEPQYYVSLSSTLLIAWSVSAFVLPGIATALTQLVGLNAFMYVAVAVAGLYAAFVAYRLTRREPAPLESQEPYQPISGQVPHTPELAPQAPEEAPNEVPGDERT